MPDAARLSRRSALQGIEAVPSDRAQSETVTIELLPPRTRFSLRLSPPLLAQHGVIAGFMLDIPINRRQSTVARTAMRLGPDEWQLSCPEAEAMAIGRYFEAGLAALHHALVDISHRHVAFSVAGPAAAATLNAGCPLDLSPQAFGAGHATRTLLGKSEIILSRPGEAPAFEIECARSFGLYVRDFLLEAVRGAEG